MTLLKTFGVIGALGLSVVITACQKHDAGTENKAQTTPAAESAVKTLTIGFQKSSLNLLIAKQQKIYEQEFPGAKIEWREFPAGPQMLEALAVGAVDFGAVGNTPPILLRQPINR